MHELATVDISCMHQHCFAQIPVQALTMRSSGRCLYRRQHGTRLAGLRDAGGRPPTRCAPAIAMFETVGNGRCRNHALCSTDVVGMRKAAALSSVWLGVVVVLQSTTRYNPEPTPTATLANVTHTDGNYGARELTLTCRNLRDELCRQCFVCGAIRFPCKH